jgi:hypothetical protein
MLTFGLGRGISLTALAALFLLQTLKFLYNKRLVIRILISRWREIRACNGNACGASKGQNFHDSLLDLRFLIVATDPKAPIY